MKYVLTATRFLIGFAVTLHVKGLKAAVKQAERRVLKAIKHVSTAQVVHITAVETTRMTAAAIVDAKAAVADLRATASATAIAAKAEAKTLARSL